MMKGIPSLSPDFRLLLLTGVFDEYLLARGDRFDVHGFGRHEADALAEELAEATRIARQANSS
jgi:hypothetical protein